MRYYEFYDLSIHYGILLRLYNGGVSREYDYCFRFPSNVDTLFFIDASIFNDGSCFYSGHFMNRGYVTERFCQRVGNEITTT